MKEDVCEVAEQIDHFTESYRARDELITFDVPIFLTFYCSSQV